MIDVVAKGMRNLMFVISAKASIQNFNKVNSAMDPGSGMTTWVRNARSGVGGQIFIFRGL